MLFKDLVAYDKRRSKERRAALSRLANEVDEAGFYDGSYTGDEA